MFKSKRKKTTALIIGGISILLSLSIASVFIASCSQNVIASSIPNDLISQGTNFDFKSTPEQINYQNDGSFTQIGIFYQQELNQTPRRINNQYYQTQALLKYGKDYHFQYPSWYYNYEQPNVQNWKFTNSNGDWIDGRDVCYSEKVINENGEFVDANNNVTTSENAKVRYTNQWWIKNEIKNNRLKKHPAADGLYEQKIDKDVKATTKRFIVNTAMTGPLMLGLYAPAGEIITLRFSEETFKLISQNNYQGVQIVINSNYWDNKYSGSEGDGGGISNRYPFIRTYFDIDPQKREIKFGSPFGGGISLAINSPLELSEDGAPYNNQPQNLDFIVSGGVKTLFYNDGLTTREDWNQQIALAKQHQLAPIMQANSSYYAWTLPFTGIDRIWRYGLDDIAYPKNLFAKWNDFFFLSNYFAGRDISQTRVRIDMEFCDDIWGPAVAWGGGNAFYCPIDWGARAFISTEDYTTDVFNAKETWGIFHEINHNFQQNAALFKRITHGKTNQVNLFDLSVISDIGRFRNEYNYTGERSGDGLGGWAYIENPYVAISQLVSNNVQNSNDEYPLQAILVYTLGPKNLADYTRWDVRNYPNTASGWNGLWEILELSHVFKINFWPAFEKFGYYWNDSWPSSYEQATSYEKTQIDELNKYPAMDFVANQYAVGSYLYDYLNNDYIYTGDSVAPMDIVAGQPHTLDLEKFVVSTNNEFNWTSVKFNPTTKYGGTLSLDPQNPKKLIYTPPKDISNVDEFDIEIIPGEWASKAKNYVPSYKFKIKMRQVINEPVLEVFHNLDPNKSYEQLTKEIVNFSNPVHTQPLGFFDTKMFSGNAGEAIRVKFKYIVPQDGYYQFQNTWDDFFIFRLNGQIVFESYWYNSSWANTYKHYYKKGDVLNIEYDVLNKGGAGGIRAQVYYSPTENGQYEYLDLFKQILISNYETITNEQPQAIIDNPSYKYQPRRVDYELYNKTLTNGLNLANYQFPTIDSTNYLLTAPNDNKNIRYLNNFNNDQYYEVWNTDHTEINVDFRQPTLVKSLLIGHRTNNHTEARPTWIKVINLTDGKEEVLYDDRYGSEFNDRYSYLSAINFIKPAKVLKLRIEMLNWNLDGFSFKWLKLSNQTFYPHSNSFAINNQKIKLTAGWKFKENNIDTNLSQMNSLSLYSNNPNDAIEFYLNNADGFAIVGQKSEIKANFDVYINDIKIASSNTMSTKKIRMDNQVLYSYFKDKSDKQPLKVRIVHTDNQPLYLDYIMTFGKDNAYLS